MSKSMFGNHPDDNMSRDWAIHSFMSSIICLHDANPQLLSESYSFLASIMPNEDSQSHVLTSLAALKALHSNIAILEFDQACFKAYDNLVTAADISEPYTNNVFEADKQALSQLMTNAFTALLKDRENLTDALTKERINSRMHGQNDEMLSSRAAVYPVLQSMLWTLTKGDPVLNTAVESELEVINVLSKSSATSWKQNKQPLDEIERRLISDRLSLHPEAQQDLTAIIKDFRGVFDPDHPFDVARMIDITAVAIEQLLALSQLVTSAAQSTQLAAAWHLDGSQGASFHVHPSIVSVNPSDAYVTIRQSAQDSFKRNLNDLYQASGAPPEQCQLMLSCLGLATFEASHDQIAHNLSEIADLIGTVPEPLYQNALNSNFQGLQKTFDASQAHGQHELNEDLSNTGRAMVELMRGGSIIHDPHDPVGMDTGDLLAFFNDHEHPPFE